MIQTIDPETATGRSLEQLSPREREVLDLLGYHMTNKQIARELGIAETTVDKHLRNIRDKWGTNDRYETARVMHALGGWENPHPEIPSGDDDAAPAAEPLSDLPRSSVFQFSDSLNWSKEDNWDTPAPMGLEALDRHFGKVWRVVAIPVLALIISMIAAWALLFAKELSDLL